MCTFGNNISNDNILTGPQWLMYNILLPIKNQSIVKCGFIFVCNYNLNLIFYTFKYIHFNCKKINIINSVISISIKYKQIEHV